MIFTPEFDDGKSGIPLCEYPRPQFKRDSYFPLNGEWDYAVTSSRETPTEYDGKILVPYSPESKASGAARGPKADEFLHYRRFFTLPDGFDIGRVLLNVGACDQVCEIKLNGITVGSHEGGYLPFAVELTAALKSGENELTFVVTDDASSHIYGRGKQSYARGGIWYTATSGIWQSVWLESVPETYIRSVKLTPDCDSRTLKVSVDCDADALIEAFDGDKVIASGRGRDITLDVSVCKPWSPSSPELYPIRITAGSDVVESYFGLRSFTETVSDGTHLFAVNGIPVFHNGLLDQGYWRDGIYTPPSARAMYDGIKAVVDLGFNMLRKHIKIEPALWYYYCDVLGVLVWQDMINGGGRYSKLRINLCPFVNLHINDRNYRKMKRDDTASREWFMREAADTIKTLYNAVSVCLWTPFNEAWGQFDAVEVWKKLRAIDDTRLYDHASGWQDKGGGNIKSRHIYFRKVRLKRDKKRILALTEFGGYSFTDELKKKTFGYKKFESREKYSAAVTRLYEKEILPLIKKAGLSATVYTQLTDVEDEINGLFTPDGKLKPDGAEIARVNAKLKNAFDGLYAKPQGDDR